MYIYKNSSSGSSSSNSSNDEFPWAKPALCFLPYVRGHFVSRYVTRLTDHVAVQDKFRATFAYERALLMPKRHRGEYFPSSTITILNDPVKITKK